MHLFSKLLCAECYHPFEYTILEDDVIFPSENELKKHPKWPGTIIYADKNFELIDTYKAWLEVKKQMETAKYIAADTETEGLGKLRHRIIGYCFSFLLPHKQKQGVLGHNLRNVYIPVRHRTGDRNLQPEIIAQELSPILQDPTKVWMWWNAKYDLHMYKQENLPIPQNIIDGMIYRRLLYSERYGRLKEAAKDEIDPGASNAANIMDIYVKALCRYNKWRVPKNNDPVGRSYYEYIPTKIAAAYGARDTFYTYEITLKYLNKIKEDKQLQQLAAVEHLFMRILFEMESFGLYVDREQVEYNIEYAQQELKNIEQRIKSKIGDLCSNLASNQQVGNLFRKLKIPFIKVTPSTAKLPPSQQVPVLNEDTLLLYKKKGYEIAGDILEWRKIEDICSKYLNGLLKIMEHDQRIHASYRQLGAATGRISSSGPNMQNFPSRGKLAPLVRKCLIMPPELQGQYVWIFADLSQIELRILAHVTQDANMMQAYKEGRDLHSETAKIMFGSVWQNADEKKRKILRTSAKAINFGLVYGMGPSGLSLNLFSQGIERSIEECKNDLNIYFKARPLVLKWIKQTKQFLRKHGYVRNLFGRIRRFPKILSRTTPSNQIAAMERAGVNFMIQGAAADHYKLGCVYMYEQFKKEGLRVFMQNTIHDEIQFHVHYQDLKRAVDIVKWAFCEKAAQWSSVPIVMDFEYSLCRWSDKKELTTEILNQLACGYLFVE